MIRPLVYTDAPAYKELRLLALKTDPLSFLSSHESESLQPLQFFIQTITRTSIPPIFGIYGYFENQKLIGTIQISPETLAKTAHRAMIYFLYVLPDSRHHAIATQLLQHIKSLAKATTLEQLHLCVNSHNQPAIKLYQKVGFTLVGTKPRGVKEPNGSYQDELLYYLPLS